MIKYLLVFLAGLAAASPVWAHHPLGGMPMETFTHGLLSGVGHPLLGFDHLFFVLAVGVAAAAIKLPFRAPLVYVGAMLSGCFLMSIGIDLVAKEVLIAVSLLVIGTILLSGRGLSAFSAVSVFAFFGLFHGSAFGDAIAAQEAGVSLSVLSGYLLGLGMVQYALACGAGYVIRKVWQGVDSASLAVRLAGAAVAGIGALLALEQVEGLAFSLLGIGV